MTYRNVWKSTLLIPVLAAALGACATGPQVTRTQEVSDTADTPYNKILVITLFSSFDSRRNLENEVVSRLTEMGTEAVASTSMMNTRTPVTRATFMAMVEDIDADAVLVTQLSSLRSEGTVVDMNPESTVNVRPTIYYNVFSVDTKEYVEPQAVDFEHSLVLVTDLYSVSKQETVWGIESRSRISQGFDQVRNYAVIVDEAEAIARYLSRDGLISQ
jgi:hypothetical protein